MKGDRRRGRGLWAAIVDDPYRKLMAIGLAVVMWYLVNSRTTASFTRNLPLTVDTTNAAADSRSNQLTVLLPSEDYVLRRFLDGDQEITSVDVTLTGPRFKIEAISSDESLNLIVQRSFGRRVVGQENEGKDVDFFEFTAQDIRRDRLPWRDVKLEIKPAHVRIEYLIKGSFSIDLPSDENLIQIEEESSIKDRVVRDSISYSLSKLTVVGPGAAINKLQNQVRTHLFKVVLKQQGSQLRAAGQIELIDGEELGLSIRPPTSVTASLKPKVDVRTLEVPVFVDDLALPPEQRGMFVPDPKTLEVPIEVSGDLLTQLTSLDDQGNPKQRNSWVKENFRLMAYVDPRLVESQAKNCPVVLVATGDWLAKHGNEAPQYRLRDPETVNLVRKQ